MHSALLRLMPLEKLARVLLLRWISSWVSVAAKWSGVWKAVSDSEGLTPSLTFTGDAEKRRIEAALSLFTFGLLAKILHRSGLKKEKERAFCLFKKVLRDEFLI